MLKTQGRVYEILLSLRFTRPRERQGVGGEDIQGKGIALGGQRNRGLSPPYLYAMKARIYSKDTQGMHMGVALGGR